MGGFLPVGSLDVEVGNLRSSRGVLRLCMTAAPGNFPSCKDGGNGITRTVAAQAGRFRIDGLPPGDYAVAIIHDENGNGKLDTVMGIPREGFGFSRNPAIGFGPPRFSAARFGVSAGAEEQQVRIRYLF
ncbi:hypothetical protein TS85_20470 [Sphingomonas hengshuiensis]|uniref:DUF2141 domain-containing protein n=1 Tax=Sphingomonas hengshuiensis TaxID=1609977 RepID=A0A7U5BG80_9SPHN|nr:hypothetical protein TS85_20470 [Sphingomonas hengshuiensis]